jgi:predicted transposase YbfD/YdcC
MSLSPAFMQHFAGVLDPRKDTHNKRHLLSDILVITILAVLCGAETWTDIAEFGKAKHKWLKSFLALPHGIPSHDTFGDVFARLDSKALEASFMSWVQSLLTLTKGEIIPIDGKTLRGSYSKRDGRRAIHMVSAWASANGLVLGQLKTAEKSNEISVIPELLGMLDVTGCVVTIDAMGTQKEIAKTIIAKEADYVLALKENQPQLYADVKLFLEDGQRKGFKGIAHDYEETVEKDHGRIEIRRYWVTGQIDWLEGRAQWKQLQSIGMVEAERHIGEQVSKERRFYINSIAPSAALFAKAVRSHWSIENQLHWSLDVSFGEDASRIRKDNAPENFAIIRRIALNMLKRETSAKVGLKIKRNKAGWDNRYLAKILEASGF